MIANYEAEDNYAEEAYDRHRDACAHFPKDIWDKVSHMNQAQALMVGEELLAIKKQTAINRVFAESIYGNSLGKTPESLIAS
jgi:hypothetical protein